MITYKVVELFQVTDIDIEEALNEWSHKGWHFDNIRFVLRDGQRRPGLAFIMFTKNIKVENKEEIADIDADIDEEEEGDFP